MYWTAKTENSLKIIIELLSQNEMFTSQINWRSGFEHEGGILRMCFRKNRIMSIVRVQDIFLSRPR